MVWRPIYWAVAATLALSALVTSPSESVAAVEAFSDGEIAEATCAAPDGASIPIATLQMPASEAEQLRMRDETPPSSKWLESDAAQSALERLDADIATRPDVVGTFLDFEAAQFVVVADPSSDGNTIRDAALASADSHLEVVVRTACRAKSEIDAQLRAVQSAFEDVSLVLTPTGDVQAEITSIGIVFDPATTSVVIFSEAGERGAIVRRLENIASEYLVVEDGYTHFAGSRQNDVETHFGAAGIRPQSAGANNCTSNVAFRWDGVNPGGWWMPTALHCGADPFWNSGSGYYGARRNPTNAASDMMLIGSSNKLYSRRMWTNPLTPNNRVITSKTDLNVGRAVCANGARTLAVCGGTVTQSYLHCQPANVCVFRWIAQHPSMNLANHGDSGGPLFGRHGTDEASARGMIHGGFCGMGNPCNTISVSSYVQMEQRLGGVVATSGAPRTS